ncbi:MAG: hypothetical protein ACPLKS_08085 [Caldisericum exile]|uniref:hypothetical protein n=1 Tax=Caldisericum exile TaxID=693075 RepID=UPI003C70D902
MKKTLLIFFSLFALLISISLFCQCPECDTSNFILSIKPEDSDYLYYGLFQNIFDSCGVSYEIGEFRIVDATGSIRRIYLEFDSTIVSDDSPYKYENETSPFVGILGSPTKGIDTILSSVLKTQIFIYPPNSKIRFYRVLEAYKNCDVVKRDTNLSYCDEIPNISSFFLIEKNNCIIDTSEWVLYLIRASDGQIITIIDSVGFLPNQNCPFAPAYGTNPYRMNQEIDLPNQFANEPVYIKLSVRRYGPSPFGMFFNPTHGRVSSSSIREYDATNGCEFGYKCNFKISWFEHYYYRKVIEYLDSIAIVKNRPPCMSEVPELWFFSKDSNFVDRILSRYFQYDSVNNFYYNTFCRDQYDSILGRFPPPEAFTFNKTPKDNIFISNLITQMKENSFELKLKVTSVSPLSIKDGELTNCQFNIYNYYGKLLFSKNNLNLKLETWETLTIPFKLARGVYLVTISNQNFPKVLSRFFFVK